MNLLLRYQELKKEVALLEEEIDLLRTVNPRASEWETSGRATGFIGDSIGGWLVRVERFEKMLDKLRNEMHAYECAIKKFMLELNEDEKIIVQMRYLDNLPWNKVCFKLQLSSRQTFRIHKKILKKAMYKCHLLGV